MLDSMAAIADDFYRNSKYATYGANYASTVKSLLNNFEAETGKITLFSHCTPKSGPLGIRARNAEDLKAPLKPLTTEYYDLGRQLLESKVGVEMFVVGKEVLMPQEFPTIHYICSLTGGALRFYCPFTSQKYTIF